MCKLKGFKVNFTTYVIL